LPPPLAEISFLITEDNDRAKLSMTTEFENFLTAASKKHKTNRHKLGG
jgi:hypothetical protein